MANDQDNAQRTEEPTPKKLREARKKGDAPKSQEATTAVMLAAGAIGLWLAASPIAKSLAATGALFLGNSHEIMTDAGALQRLFAETAASLATSLGMLTLLFVIAALVANITQALPVFTAERLKPSLQKISPLAGAKRIFGPSGLFNFAKGVGKIVIVGIILAVAIWPERDLLAKTLFFSGGELLSVMQSLSLRLVGLAVAAMVVIGGLDYAFQRHAWRKRLRMTKEEVRRELKESEGDPQIKGRQRQLRESRMRKRMLAAVKDATVLIMNPTHFAVALEYESGAQTAPICVAKGLDDLALRMRAEAQKYGVPVVENPPLARALYANVEIDDEIPLEHYEAVAKVIGFILRKARGASENRPQ